MMRRLITPILMVAFVIAGIAIFRKSPDEPKGAAEKLRIPTPIAPFGSSIGFERVTEAARPELNGAEWEVEGQRYPCSLDNSDRLRIPFVFGKAGKKAKLISDEGSEYIPLKANGIAAPKLATVTAKAGPFTVTYKPWPIISPAFPIHYDVSVSGPGPGAYACQLYLIAPPSLSQEHASVLCDGQAGIQVIPTWEKGDRFEVYVSKVSKKAVPLRVERVHGITKLLDPRGNEVIVFDPPTWRYGNVNYGARLDWGGKVLAESWLLRTATYRVRHESLHSGSNAQEEDFSQIAHGGTIQATSWSHGKFQVGKLDLRLPDPALFEIQP